MSKRDGIRAFVLTDILYQNVQMLNMMNEAVKAGADFDEEAEDIAIDLLCDIHDICLDIVRYKI